MIDLHPAFELPSSSSLLQTTAMEEEKDAETGADMGGVDLSEEVVSVLAEALRAAPAKN